MENIIKRAEQKHPKISFKVMDATNLKFKNNSFDTEFFSYNGIDYIFPKTKRMKFFKEAFRTLKNNGVLTYSSHKRFYLDRIIRSKYPFIGIHYMPTMLASLVSFNSYRYEKHPFGWVKTYCKNDSSHEPIAAGFKKVLRIPFKSNCHYICYK